MTRCTSVGAGPQRDSRRCNSARAIFGEETRDGRNKQFMDEELEKAFYGRGTPGPIYELLESFGKQPLSTKESAHSAKFGTQGRFGPAMRGSAAPGPIYDSCTSALGRQPFSRRATLPAFGFGSSTRDGARAV